MTMNERVCKKEKREKKKTIKKKKENICSMRGEKDGHKMGIQKNRHKSVPCPRRLWLRLRGSRAAA